MSKTRKFWRYFLAHQDQKQEEWLEAQARRGLRLTRPGLFRFSFEEAEPEQQKYRLDFQMLRGSKRDEYITLFRDAGWEFLGQVSSRYYFRARPDALAPEIFTDADSKRNRIRRQMRFMACITGILAWNTFVVLSRAIREPRIPSGFPEAMMIGAIGLVTSCTVLGVWCLWQMERAYRAVR